MHLGMEEMRCQDLSEGFLERGDGLVPVEVAQTGIVIEHRMVVWEMRSLIHLTRSLVSIHCAGSRVDLLNISYFL